MICGKEGCDLQAITYQELKRLAKASVAGNPTVRIAILGDSATQQLAVALKGMGTANGLALQVFDADYDQMDAQTVDPHSALYAFAPDYMLIFPCVEKLLMRYQDTPPEARALFAEAECRRYCALFERVARYTKAKLLLVDFPACADGVFGNGALRTAESFPYQRQLLNTKLAEKLCNDYPNVYPIALSAIQVQLGQERFYDARIWHLAKLAVRTEVLPLFASAVLDVIQSLRGQIKKCVVVDLDNTLWGGVIGDDGLEGIELGELGAGPAFIALQRWLKNLRERGVLLAVCSKNNADIAMEVFEKHPDMILRLSDIAMFVANWDDKASNIRHIQQTLNIGMDSIVFLDDNPFERDLVRTVLPAITVPELPDDPAMVLPYLQSLCLFEAAGCSDEDRLRTKRYQAQINRAEAEQNFDSYEAYLASLHMQAVVEPFAPFYFARIAQLSQRSNQFNLRTVRYTEAEIAAIADDDRYITRYMTLSDRFGEHGLVSVVILQKRQNALFIDTWLMSCRVLRRGAEQYLFDRVVEAALANGFDTLVGEYLPTAKNAMVAEFYTECGMTALGNGLFTLDCKQYQPHKTAISASIA